jgi:adenine-specific DNA-methyltransferase
MGYGFQGQGQIWLHTEAGNNHEAREESKLIDAAEVFGTPKPEKLMRRVLALASNPADLVLDSFLGSGTTAAVAHKMGRRWIGIEMGEHAATHCLPRLQKVIDGEQGGISAAVGWQGGGVEHRLAQAHEAKAAAGRIQPQVRFAALAAHVWQQETRSAYIAPAPGARVGTPLVGTHDGRAIYLLFNGILGDRRPEGGNVLTLAVLQALKTIVPHDGPKVVYAEACRLGEARLAAEGIVFRQMPYELAAR